MADQIVITEKTSQAKDIRAAVGSRYGDILPAEGHLLAIVHLNEQIDRPISGSIANAAAEPAGEGEITPEMIEVGVSELLNYDSRFESAESAVERIYYAMLNVAAGGQYDSVTQCSTSKRKL